MALSQDEMLAIIAKLYAATSVGDFDTAETYLTDDFFITEAEALPFAGVYRGRRALRDLYTHVMSMMDVAGLDVIQHVSGGDTVISVVRFSFQDPALQQAELCELYRFRGDKVCEIKPYYFDPAPIIAACNAKTAAAD